MADTEKPEPAAEKPATAPAAPPASAPKPPVKPAVPVAAKAEKAPPPPPGPPDPPPPADAAVPACIQALQAALPGAVVQVSWFVGDWTVIVAPDRILDVAKHLRDTDGARFDYCSDVTAVDWPARADVRFDVVYCLYSTVLRHRVRVKVRVADLADVPSVSGVWAAANWLEREVWDLFGIRFSGHPDPRRILMPEEWQGHPQRKDYPLEGPGELIMEGPQEWLKLRQSINEAEIE
jgi:NADH-quinone oxidoreductase subunit C